MIRTNTTASCQCLRTCGLLDRCNIVDSSRPKFQDILLRKTSFVAKAFAIAEKFICERTGEIN
jgi:hypothetical protein